MLRYHVEGSLPPVLIELPNVEVDAGTGPPDSWGGGGASKSSHGVCPGRFGHLSQDDGEGVDLYLRKNVVKDCKERQYARLLREP